MPKSSKSFLFPDLNVWIALTYTKHIHYNIAQEWFLSLAEEMPLCFCRFTQIGFLRLLTTPAVMGDEAASQTLAWAMYDDWLLEGGALLLEEPPGIEIAFRNLARSQKSTHKDWSNSYIGAFAIAGGLQLVTFDRALQRRIEGSTLLQS